MGGILFGIGWVVVAVLAEETGRRAGSQAKKSFEQGVLRLTERRKKKKLKKSRMRQLKGGSS